MYDSNEILHLHYAATKQDKSLNADIRAADQAEDLLIQQRLKTVRGIYIFASVLTMFADQNPFKFRTVRE